MTIGIVGGGAAALFFVGVYTGSEEILVFEGTDRVGKKLLTTGNGRGNLTSGALSPDRYHTDAPETVAKILRTWDREQVERQFLAMGIPLTEEEEKNKVFPLTLQASTVVNRLRHILEEKATLYPETKIKKVQKVDKGYLLEDQHGERFFVDRVILATGGRSMEKTGSDGGGYPLGESLGHHLAPRFPALVPLQTDDRYRKHLAGTKVRGRGELFIDGKSAGEEEGEFLFTDYGISGPPILDFSRRAIEAWEKGKSVVLELPLINDLTSRKKEEIEALYYWQYERPVREFLEGVVHKKFHSPLIRESGMDPGLPRDQQEEKKHKLFSLLYGYRLNIVGHRGWGAAQVTCGGLLLSEFTEDLASKISPGCYGMGEVLNVDGDCGGFNLHWAWASALTVAKKINLG